ncbi:acyl-CoA dehydrogenase [Desulfobotulus sp.]|jgi:alkylation response protein AidB-like acyl-CoA dehydrogenase|uniref:acyl-CoA dehydrogenase n=1 Tax=Desulfobotulus sp. TaxID=1940337 RepID=UPI002A359095|nr:acyl-CoA dehydrogenase [Desulfobotulus sp.]MDY0163009.1 acyl-CoA dehydrogenase [Desulfobotulus sp.]
MAQLIADRRDVDFVLHEQFEVSELAKAPRFADFNRKTIDLIVTEARNLAIKEILPLQKISDNPGCQFDAGKVTVPEAFHKVYKTYCDGQWLAMSDSPEWGGQGMPTAVGLAANEYFYGACNSFMLFNMLTHGAARLIESFGTQAQKDQVLKNMYSGKWSGTMLLTEPVAGSDVGALTTTAKRNPDGTYSISGAKIFISGGEQDMVENIIHPTLARVEGAPAGTRGISLFLVPKYRINADGSLGAFNDVVCTGIEHKMGLHGNSTCSLTLGGKGECIGTLIGEENKGMAHMFQMMNEARQMVGLQGFANATASFMYALDYARQRIQTKHMTDPPEAGPSAIIRHPDVRRQLMLMKSLVEGMRSLIYFNGMVQDRHKLVESAEEKERLRNLEEVLTPIIKGYITDKAFEVCSHGVQVYGGYGYIEEYPVAQLLRDCRIFQIYEGTNGIQSIDLVGRKMGMKKGAAFMAFLEEIRKTIELARGIDAVRPLAENLEKLFNTYTETAAILGKAAGSDKVLDAFAFTHPFLEATGDLTMAWMLLWRAAVAAPKIGQKKKDDAFYQGQVTTARFFINSQLPITAGRLAAIQTMDGAAIAMEDAGFGG